MIVKIDDQTTAQLRDLEKKVRAAVQAPLRSQSMIAQVILQWALKRLTDSTIRELAPRMLSPTQQKKALIDEITSFKGPLDQRQLKSILKQITKLKQVDQTLKSAEKDAQI